MKLLISPYSSRIKNDNDPTAKNAKNFPFWDRLIILLTDNGHIVNQIGVKDETRFKRVSEFYQDKSIPELIEITNSHDLWISVDNFFPHFAHYYTLKSGVVIWGKSDPQLFGYPDNINILKDKKFLRPGNIQFLWWHYEPFVADAFQTPQRIYDIIQKHLNEKKNTG